MNNCKKNTVLLLKVSLISMLLVLQACALTESVHDKYIHPTSIRTTTVAINNITQVSEKTNGDVVFCFKGAVQKYESKHGNKYSYYEPINKKLTVKTKRLTSVQLSSQNYTPYRYSHQLKKSDQQFHITIRANALPKSFNHLQKKTIYEHNIKLNHLGSIKPGCPIISNIPVINQYHQDEFWQNTTIQPLLITPQLTAAVNIIGPGGSYSAFIQNHGGDYYVYHFNLQSVTLHLVGQKLIGYSLMPFAIMGDTLLLLPVSLPVIFLITSSGRLRC